MSKIAANPSGAVMEEKKDAASISHHEEGFCVQEVGKDDGLKSAIAEMGEVKEENERLKMMLERVEKDYQSLQLRFFDILQKEASEKGSAEGSVTSLDETEEPEMVSLRLGRNPREPKKDERNGTCNKAKENEDFELASNCLTLGLDATCQLSMELASESSEEPKETEAGGETWPTSKSVKARNGDDEISDQMPTKRARVSVRARCDTPTMNDGCQWRKYGQKIAKGNPSCPRAYYRCTVAPACPVRKQVQRCAEDMSILITTYEGTHNHPLPVSATAMASTTSAAASMLLSDSSTSQPSTHSSALSGTVFNGLSFSHFDQSRAKQGLFPNHAASPLFPTITLDLTSASSSSPAHVTRLPSNIASGPRYPPTNLSFCSKEPTIIPAVWGNGFPNNGTLAMDKPPMRSLNLGNQFQEHFYQQYMKNQAPSRDALAKTLTKVISTDPSLRSVIAAAVTSVMGQGSSNRNHGGEVSGPGLSLSLGNQHAAIASKANPMIQNGKGMLPGYFNWLSSSSSPNGGLMLQSPLPFSVSKSSTAPSIIDQINH
ncbi:hypothetical protein L6164_005952 [Bauhinia variegata]|uniref:Uncharacterized protein n=1 Tax=Bauhinia variegata TaxID=167791 RepID=A0ACB9PSV6_BAUVA|nr:hypothetical protein L6164_005952 [Bauhinia variegata]